MLARVPDVEVACNQAHGTLVEITTNPALLELGAEYPPWAHEAVASAARLTTKERSFACHHDYQKDYGAHLANIPRGAVSLRTAILHPEGLPRAGAPRPDSSKNPFCLTCHTEDSRGGLSLAALAFDPNVLAENDPRRQPLQPPRRVFGNIPAGWLQPGVGPGSPSTAQVAPAEGALIDLWLLPSASAP